LETARARAEEFLREMARAGDSSQQRGQGALEELLEASRKGTEHLVGSIRQEIANQVQLLGLATKRDLSNLEAKLRGTSSGPKRSGAAKKSATQASAAKKAPAKKAPAKKAPAKKAAAATKSTAKSAAKKATAKAAPAKKTPAKKTPAKKTPAKKASG
jgi:polyhydroxyalkanoate synthesis regulator phasin